MAGPRPTAAAIADPLAAVAALYAAAGRPGADGDWGVEAFFTALADDPELAAQVPCLNTCNIDAVPVHGLVKYRGMVQSPANPEFYYPAPTPGGGVTKFCDAALLGGGGDAGDGSAAPPRLWQRTPLYCCAVPGEPPPAGPAPVPAPSAPARAQAKRGRDADGDEGMADVQGGGEGPADKAPRAASAAPVRPDGREGQAKAGGDPQAAPADGPPPVALPPPAAGDAAVLFYGADPPRVTQVVEVWGVLSRDPGLAAGGAAGDGHPFFDAGPPPTSLLPRVHALALRPVPLVASPAPPLAGPGPAAAAREAALAELAAALGGDALAAEYLLLQLAVAPRPPGAAAGPGLLSLNILGCPKGAAGGGGPGGLTAFGARVAAAVAALAPRCVALPVTVDSLNAARLRPAACPRTDRLARTPLQLPPGAALVLDETGLTPGHLTPTGADSAAALAELLGADKAVAYDYCGVRHPVPAHGGGVVLSAGSSVLRAVVDVSLPLAAEAAAAAAAGVGAAGAAPAAADAGASTAAPAADASAPLAAARALVAAARGLDPAVPDDGDAVERAVAWIAAARQAGEADVQGGLHRQLLLARAVAASLGRAAVCAEAWDRAVTLEAQRAARLAAVTVRAAYAG